MEAALSQGPRRRASAWQRPGGKHPLFAQETQYALTLAEWRFIDIKELRPIEEGKVKVVYRWEWAPNEMGRLFIAKGFPEEGWFIFIAPTPRDGNMLQ